MRKFLLLLTSLLIILGLTGCSYASKSDAKKSIKNNIDVKCEFVSQEENEKGIKYYFKDENGIEFYFYSRKNNISIDGANFGYTIDNNCNYGKAYIAFYEEEINKILEKTKAKYSIDEYGDYEITIKHYNQLERLTEAFDKIFNQYTIPLIQERVYDIPVINFLVPYQSYPFYEIPYQTDYMDEFDKLTIYNELKTEYITTAKNHNQVGDLPKSELINFKPESIENIYIDGTLANIEMFNYTSLSAYLYNNKYEIPLRVGNATYLGGTLKLEELFDQVGIPYEITSTTSIKWMVGNNEFEIKPVGTTAYIFKNEEKYQNLKLAKYREDETLDFYIKVEDFEKLFGLETEVDTIHARIFIKT